MSRWAILQKLPGCADHPHPPVHLLLGSDAAGLVKKADEDRMAELEQWLPVSISTDYDGAVNFLETDIGKKLLGNPFDNSAFPQQLPPFFTNIIFLQTKQKI